jgi:hypothetical protein
MPISASATTPVSSFAGKRRSPAANNRARGQWRRNPGDPTEAPAAPVPAAPADRTGRASQLGNLDMSNFPLTSEADT